MLKDNNNTPLTRKSVKCYIDNVLDGTYLTSANGEVNYENYNYFDGTHTIKAVFEGDSTYEASQLEKTVTIGGGPGPGPILD